MLCYIVANIFFSSSLVWLVAWTNKKVDGRNNKPSYLIVWLFSEFFSIFSDRILLLQLMRRTLLSLLMWSRNLIAWPHWYTSNLTPWLFFKFWVVITCLAPYNFVVSFFNAIQNVVKRAKKRFQICIIHKSWCIYRGTISSTSFQFQIGNKSNNLILAFACP